MDTFKRVDLCKRHELHKDGNGHARIYKDGKLLLGGSEYLTCRKWLDVKAKMN